MNQAGPGVHYPIDSATQSELDRLRRQHDAWHPAAEWLVAEVGVSSGWHCLDLGCGPEGLTTLLAERVGRSGRVVGLDANADFIDLAHARAQANVEYVLGDAYDTGLPPESFDLVHFRFLASTAGEAERLLAEASRLLRPGGFLLAQEADARSLNVHPPHRAWSRLRGILEVQFPACFDPYPVAHQLFGMLKRARFEGVRLRPCIVGTDAANPWWDYLPATLEALRPRLIRQGDWDDSELSELIDACRAHLADESTTVNSVSLIQVFGQRAC
ncbi:MAG: methyltransferase domain-containing protein [Pseudomonadota bacterium]